MSEGSLVTEDGFRIYEWSSDLGSALGDQSRIRGISDLYAHEARRNQNTDAFVECAFDCLSDLSNRICRDLRDFNDRHRHKG
jgi:hypothetical protein